MVGLDGNPTDHRCVGWLGWMGTLQIIDVWDGWVGWEPYRSQKCGITVGLGWKGPYRTQYHSVVGLEGISKMAELWDHRVWVGMTL